MFSAIRRFFRKIRILTGALRAGLYGIVTVAAAWLMIAPPSPTEIARLDLGPDATAGHDLLRGHRIAKLVAMVGTERIYQLIADRAGDGITADDVRLSVQLAANGQPIKPGEEFAPNAEPPIVQENADGAKFIAARKN